MARPTKYTTELGLLICARLLEGQSLRAICREDKSLPSASTIFLWLGRHSEFYNSYRRTKELTEEILCDDILDIADDDRKDSYLDKGGQRKINSTNLARDRMRIDTRKWHLARIALKKGDRLREESSPSAMYEAEKSPPLTRQQFAAELDETRLKFALEDEPSMEESGPTESGFPDGSDLC